MKSLNKFVNDYNNFDVKFFKAKPIDLTKAADRQRVADMIDCKLSPENLSCDGELSRTEVNRRYNHLTSAAKDLLTLDPKVKFYEFA
jgi:hypothetical protein